MYMDDVAFLKHVAVSFLTCSTAPTLYLLCVGLTVRSFQVNPKDECFLNSPIENYDQMKIIFGRPRVQNPLAVNTLHLALSYLMDHEEERLAYLAGNEKERKIWYYSYYRALFRAMEC